MADSDKRFLKPPLVEVAFEILFKPKLRITEKLSEFQDSIEKEYPEFEQHVALIIPPPLGAVDKLDKNRLISVFRKADDSKIVRIGVDRFNFIDKSYTTFDAFKSELVSIWGKFAELVGSISSTRCGLRYINNLSIPFLENPADIIEFVRPHFDYGIFSIKDAVNIKTEARMKLGSGFMTVRSSIEGTYLEEEKVYLRFGLDYDRYEENPEIGESINTVLESFHNAVEGQFRADIGPKYLKFMESGSWD
jgi:uncharacterized protein (TIGR04255 family)